MINRIAWGVFVLWIVLSLAGPLLPLDPYTIHIQHVLQPPSVDFILGTDDLGRSIFARLVTGATTSCIVAISVVTIGLIIGMLVGATAGYIGGWYDRIVVYIIDVFLAFPGILLAIALAGILGPGLDNVIIALCVVGWVGYARLIRAQVLSLREREHVKAAIALGAGHGRILLRHIVPLTLAPIIVEATFAIAGIVIAEAGLSFLGLGAQPPTASWGNMIRDGSRYLLVAPHMVLMPGLALIAIVVCTNLIGDQLRDYLDVKEKYSKD